MRGYDHKQRPGYIGASRQKGVDFVKSILLSCCRILNRVRTEMLRQLIDAWRLPGVRDAKTRPMWVYLYATQDGTRRHLLRGCPWVRTRTSRESAERATKLRERNIKLLIEFNPRWLAVHAPEDLFSMDRIDLLERFNPDWLVWAHPDRAALELLWQHDKQLAIQLHPGECLRRYGPDEVREIVSLLDLINLAPGWVAENAANEAILCGALDALYTRGPRYAFIAAPMWTIEKDPLWAIEHRTAFVWKHAREVIERVSPDLYRELSARGTRVWVRDKSAAVDRRRYYAGQLGMTVSEFERGGRDE